MALGEATTKEIYGSIVKKVREAM